MYRQEVGHTKLFHFAAGMVSRRTVASSLSTAPKSLAGTPGIPDSTIRAEGRWLFKREFESRSTFVSSTLPDLLLFLRDPLCLAFFALGVLLTSGVCAVEVEFSSAVETKVVEEEVEEGRLFC